MDKEKLISFVNGLLGELECSNATVAIEYATKDEDYEYPNLRTKELKEEFQKILDS